MGWLNDFFNDPLGTLGEVGQSIIDVVVDSVQDVMGWLLDIPDMDALEAKYKGVLVNKQSNISARPIIYGRRMVGGTRVFMASSGTDNTYLYIVLDLCEGEIHSISDIYINDVISTDAKFTGLVTVNKYLGTDGQQVDPMLLAANIGWTSAHKLSGVAYLAVRLKWEQGVFSSIPTIHAVVQGKKVYDPRTSATATVAASSNPALCLRDYLTNARYGKGLATSFIDDTLFSAAANKCDALVTSHSGSAGQQKIFECNGVIDTDQTVLTNAKSLLSSMRGLMLYRQGLYGLVIEDQGSSTFSFDESHIVGGLSIQSESKKTKFNRIIATFPNPDANWQMDQIEYPVAGSSEEAGYLTEDGGIELVKQIDLPTTTNIYTARDIAEIALKRSRNGLIVSFTATSEALNVSVGDIVSITNSTPDWSAKPFRVLKLSLNSDGTVSLTLIEHQDSIYPWSTKTEADNIPDTNLPNPFNVAAATSLAVSVGSTHYLVQTDGVVIVRANVTWTASVDQFVERYIVQWKYAADSVYANDVTTTAATAYISGFKTGETIDVRVKAVSAMGVSSAWSIVSATTITAHATAPSAPTGFTATAKQGAIELSWTNPTNADFSYIEINRHTSNSQGSSSLFVKTSNTIIIDQVGESETRYYWARAFNRSSIASAWTAVATASSTSYPVAAAASPTLAHAGLVYYATNQSSAPATPSASSYNFATGAITGLTSSWSITPPVLDIGQAGKYWSSRWAVEETTSGGGTGTPTFQTAVAQFTFDGVVTFSNSTTLTDGNSVLALSGFETAGAAAAAQTAAATDASAKAAAAQTAAISAAATAADTKAALAKTVSEAYADGVVTTEEARAIADATAKADAAEAAAIAASDTVGSAAAAQTAAISAAAADATTKANAAEAAAAIAAQTKATLAQVTASAYADGIVTAEETRAIADATAKANAAQSAAQAASDSAGSAAAAQAAAATDATNKANAAAAAALVTAANDATSKANAAVTSASTDATTKADAARVAALYLAALDATGKSNSAVTAAALDATTKADAAQVAASELSATLASNLYYTGTVEIDGGKIRADTVHAGSIVAGTITGWTINGGTIAIGTGNTPSSKAFEVNASGVVWTDGIIGGIFSGSNLNVSTAPAITGVTRQAHPALLGQTHSANSSSSAHAIRGTNVNNGNSGLVGPANGYDFYAEGSGSNYGPFTGAHDCLIANENTVSVGDLVVDVECISRRGLSNTIFAVETSSSINQAACIGVVVLDNGPLSNQVPAAFINGMTDDGVNIVSSGYELAKNSYQLMAINAVGEGQLNITGEGGNLTAGDLIVASSTAGKGMKQADDFVRSYTVARVRESVSFSSPTEQKLVACIYLCG